MAEGESKMDIVACEANGQERDLYIPGIPDEITLEHIATKLSWKTMCALTSLNRAWREAIHKREVHNIRIRTRSTERLAAVSLNCNCQQGLYDLALQWMHLLPPLPRLPSGFNSNVQTSVGTVMLDGKLFLFSDFPYGSRQRRRTEVHMMDLAACDPVWQRRRSTKINGGFSLCVACDGKIYAFSMRDKFVNGEVFDPKLNIWTQISDKPLNVCYILSYEGRMATLNKEIYVSSFGPKLMVFDSCTETWRVLENTLPNKRSVSWVVVSDKLYNLSDSRVEVYDPESNSWAEVQPILYDNFMQTNGMTPYTVMAAAFGDEVLALLEHEITFFDGMFRKLCKSVGFGIKGRPLVWEVLPSSDLQTILNTHNNCFLGAIEV